MFAADLDPHNVGVVFAVKYTWSALLAPQATFGLSFYVTPHIVI